MNKHWKITIEGSGPCLGVDDMDADIGAKALVRELKRRGHKVTRAEFAGNGKLPTDINVPAEWQTPVEALMEQPKAIIHGSMAVGSDDPPKAPGDGGDGGMVEGHGPDGDGGMVDGDGSDAPPVDQ